MPYFNNDDVYRHFSKEINAKADEEINRLQEQIADTKAKNMKRIKEELHSNIFRALELDLNEMNADFTASMNKVKTEYTKVLMKRRRELLDSIIEEVKKKCLDFVSSKAYVDFAKAKVEKVNKTFCKKEIEFRVKKGDSVMIDAIKKNFDGTYHIKEINEIEIGGFSAICFDMGILTDETIDSKLHEKQQWFYEHSDLAAKK